MMMMDIIFFLFYFGFCSLVQLESVVLQSWWSFNAFAHLISPTEYLK